MITSNNFLGQNTNTVFTLISKLLFSVLFCNVL